MIEVKDLSKSFGPLVAVDNISFTVNKGDILGFLGPNGAGKSTTMRILTCFISPTSGSVIIDGLSIDDEPIAVKKKIGYMPENAPLYAEMTTKQFLIFMAKLREIPESKRKESINKVVDMCALKEVLHQTIETLSKGFKRRVSLAQALIHDPEILIMDEPTDGLDPIQKHEVRTLIKNLSENKSIILSTHILEEVEAVCNRAIIISEGQIRFDGSPEELKSKSSTGKIDDVFRAIATGTDLQEASL